MNPHRWVLGQTLMVLISSLIIGSIITFSKTIPLIILIAGTLILIVSVYKRTFGESEVGIMRRKIGALYGALILISSFVLFLISSFQANHDRLTKFNDLQVGGKALSISTRGYVGSNSIILNETRYVPVTIKELILDNRIFYIQETVLMPTDEQLVPGEILLIESSLRTVSIKNITNQISYFIRFGGIRSAFVDPVYSRAQLQVQLSLVDKIKIFLGKNGL
jgi:hypothetical protein